MPIIDRHRALVAEGTTGRQGEILPLEVFLASVPGFLEAGAVMLPPDAAVERLAPRLEELELICVDFPKFRDGRGFTLARRLRQVFGFAGDVRAVGHVLPDQFAALVDCGFSTIATPPAHPPEQWRQEAGLCGQAPAGPLLQRLISRRPSE